MNILSITQEELARRLKAARKVCGLKQWQVAEQLELSRPTLTQIELGQRKVTSIEMQKFAYLYGRDIGDFFSVTFDDKDLLGALFEAYPQLEGQEKLGGVLRECVKLGQKLTSLERALGIEHARSAVASYRLGRPQSKWQALEQGTRVAANERRRLGLGNAPVANIAELLQSQGIHTAPVELPREVSGITLIGSMLGILVLTNESHTEERQRFSYTHEYAHVLLDAEYGGIVSHTGDREKLTEVRASLFAASFLMPAEGVHQFLRALGKGQARQLQAEVFNEDKAIQVRARAAPGSQDIQLYDVAQLAHHFATSRLAMLYRLRNLGLVTEAQLAALKEKEQQYGDETARLLKLPDLTQQGVSNALRYRFLGLGMEALRRKRITGDKFRVLAEMVGLQPSEIARLFVQMDLAP